MALTTDIPQPLPTDQNPPSSSTSQTDFGLAKPADLQNQLAAQKELVSSNLFADSMAAARPADVGAHVPATSHSKSLLESGIDTVLSVGIKDQETRQTFDKYSAEFLTTAALFAGGKVGIASTLLLYGLNSAKTDSKPLEQAEDFALGAAKGFGTRLIFNGANYLPTAPLKGLVTGVGSRALDGIVNRQTFEDPGNTFNRLETQTFNRHAMLADAVTWTVGEGLFHGGNYLSNGRLGANPLVRGMTMGASFGAVNGTNSEIEREKAAGEEISIAKVAKHGLIEAVIGGAAAGSGMAASSAIGNGGSPDVHISEGKGDRASATVKLGANGPDGEKGVTVSLADLKASSAGNKTLKMMDIPGLPRNKGGEAIPEDIMPKVPPAAKARDIGGDASSQSTDKPDGAPKTTAREFVIDSSKHEFKSFRNRQTDGTFLNVREKLLDASGKEQLGPTKLLYVQKLGTGGDNVLKAGAEKADLIVTSHPEVLTEAERAKHIFPDGEGKVWLAMSGKGKKGSTLRLATGDVQLSQWRQEGFVDPIRLDNGNVSLSVMAPLEVGDAKNPDGVESKAAWQELDRQLEQAKKLGIDAVSTDVWWGLIEPKKGEFDWRYYEKLSQHIRDAGLKWVPILSFHQCGGNVGDDVNVPLPEWVFADVASRASGGNVDAVKYKSEQGHVSPEYISLFADEHVMENYRNVMVEFQKHFASEAKNIGEVNVSLGPAGELRFPSYNSQDNNTGYPTRGALQAYGDLAISKFREYVKTKYGGTDGVARAWGIKDLDENHILPPDDAAGFFGRGDHFNTQYGRDFIDWYNQSLIDHGQRMLSTAIDVFGQKDSAFYSIDLGAKIPGVHWRVGEWQNGNIVLGDRLAEVAAGLISTSRHDWDNDADGRGYRPILSMFASLQPKVAGVGNRIVPGFTCLEMPDGDGGPSIKAMPHSLATWVGQESERQGLWLKGENALAGNLGNNYSWDLMRGFLTLPNQHGYYRGLTFLRLGDIVNNDVARDRVSQINASRAALESVRQSIRQFFAFSKAA